MKILFKIFVLLVLLISISFIGWYHEIVHQTIFAKYGIESKINLLADFPDMTTVPNQTQRELNCDENCEREQHLIDIVGYPIISVGLVIILFLSIIIINTIENDI